MTDRNGFTLLELILVMVVIGLTMAFAVPRLDLHLVSDPLKQSSRKLTQLILSASQLAVRSSQSYLLQYDPVANRFNVITSKGEEVETEPSPLQLPQAVRVQDISTAARGVQVTGQLAIGLDSRGYLEPSLIHLRDEGGRVMTLKLAPFLGKVTVHNEYLSLEEDTFR